MAKASYIMGVYNKQLFLSEAIQSILVQSVKDIELVIVDDGSTDYSEDVYRCYEGKDKRVKVFKNEVNKGISYTYNRATENTTADIILVSAADDIYKAERTKWTLDYFKKNKDVDIVYFPFIKAHYNLEPFEKKLAPKFDGELLLKPGGQFIGHGFSAYRRKVAETVKYREDLKYGIDHHFFIDCYKAGFKFGNVEGLEKLAGIYRFYDKMVSIQHRAEIVAQDEKLLGGAKNG